MTKIRICDKFSSSEGNPQTFYSPSAVILPKSGK
nr:MAG TPA: hypothetical protein [Caudoviricetes sp.]